MINNPLFAAQRSSMSRSSSNSSIPKAATRRQVSFSDEVSSVIYFVELNPTFIKSAAFRNTHRKRCDKPQGAGIRARIRISATKPGQDCGSGCRQEI